MKRYVIFLLHFFTALFTVNGQEQFLFIGTYTHTGSKGIYVYSFNPETGTLKWVSNTDSVPNPSYLAVTENKHFVYACTESRTPNAGSVSAFSFDRKTGRLTFINKQPTGGSNPVYIALHNSGKWATTANYTGGSITVFPIQSNGSFQPYSQNIQLEGSSVNSVRQESSHVHSTIFSPGFDYLYAPDLGTDKIMQYRFKADLNDPLSPLEAPAVSSTPGSGPRHMVFHPNSKFAYVAEELSGTVSVYRLSRKQGLLEPVQRIATHPVDSAGPFGSADVHVSPDGRFLYVSNRGTENNIAIFSINRKSGKLQLKGLQPTMGNHPRNFAIDKSGKYLLVANMLSDNIIVFHRNKQTGLLTFTGMEIRVPQPSCLKLITE